MTLKTADLAALSIAPGDMAKNISGILKSQLKNVTLLPANPTDIYPSPTTEDIHNSSTGIMLTTVKYSPNFALL